MGYCTSLWFAEWTLEIQCLNRLKLVSCFIGGMLMITFLYLNRIALMKLQINLILIIVYYSLPQKKSINILDMHITRIQNTLVTDWYSKPTASDRQIHFFLIILYLKRKQISTTLSKNVYNYNILNFIRIILNKPNLCSQITFILLTLSKNIKIRLNKLRNRKNDCQLITTKNDCSKSTHYCNAIEFNMPITRFQSKKLQTLSQPKFNTFYTKLNYCSAMIPKIFLSNSSLFIKN